MSNVLIAVGDRTSSELVSIICKAAKLSPVVADDGIEALMLLDSVRFDLLVTDPLLPRLNGVDLAQTIRASKAHYSVLPIIGITPKGDSAASAAMREVGVNEVIPKPFWKGTLRTALDRLLPKTS